MSNTNTTKASTAKPVYRKILPGGISAAVFENTRDGRTYRSVNLQRSYRKNNDWKRMSMYLDHEHIPFIIEVLQGTWQFLNGTPISGSQAEASTASDESSEPDTNVEEPLESAFDA